MLMGMHKNLQLTGCLKTSSKKMIRNIIILTLSCSALMGCRSGYYNEYFLLDKTLNKASFGYPYILSDTIEFEITAGTFYSYTRSLESNISVSFYFEDKNQIELFNKNNIIVFSTRFGEIKQIEEEQRKPVPRHHTENFIVYSLNLDKKKLKNNAGDTIAIKIHNKDIIYFIGKN